MTKTIHCAALLLALSTGWMPAQAQNVYRCGESYSGSPCPGAVLLAVDDPRSPAQRAQTEAATQRDARAAEALEKERLRLEAKAARPVIWAAAVTAPAKATADKALPKGKLKKPELFTAVAPMKPGETGAKKKKKAATA